jgi:hypothetical protein
MAPYCIIIIIISSSSLPAASGWTVSSREFADHEGGAVQQTAVRQQCWQQQLEPSTAAVEAEPQQQGMAANVSAVMHAWQHACSFGMLGRAASPLRLLGAHATATPAAAGRSSSSSRSSSFPVALQYSLLPAGTAAVTGAAVATSLQAKCRQLVWWQQSPQAYSRGLWAALQPAQPHSH